MEPVLKVLIIDDEEPARMIIRDYLKSYPEIEIAGECSNGFEGIKAIQTDTPDLIFLDIQMPKISGFEMLEVLEKIPEVIFSTAYDNYAIRAFENNAVDYLLKPYSQQRFNQAVDKAIDKIRKSLKPESGYKALMTMVLPEGEYLDRMVVRTGNQIQVIAIDHVEYFEAEDDYVRLVTQQGKYLKLTTMNFLEKHLNPKEFVRVHRSHIIRISQIVQIEPYDKDSKVIVLRSGSKIRASKTGLRKLKELLGI